MTIPTVRPVRRWPVLSPGLGGASSGSANALPQLADESERAAGPLRRRAGQPAGRCRQGEAGETLPRPKPRRSASSNPAPARSLISGSRAGATDGTSPSIIGTPASHARRSRPARPAGRCPGERGPGRVDPDGGRPGRGERPDRRAVGTASTTTTGTPSPAITSRSRSAASGSRPTAPFRTRTRWAATRPARRATTARRAARAPAPRSARRSPRRAPAGPRSGSTRTRRRPRDRQHPVPGGQLDRRGDRPRARGLHLHPPGPGAVAGLVERVDVEGQQVGGPAGVAAGTGGDPPPGRTTSAAMSTSIPAVRPIMSAPTPRAGSSAAQAGRASRR